MTMQRNTVKNDRGIESKYDAPWPTSPSLPSSSRSTKHSPYTGKVMSITLHMSVRMPPIMPWIMTLSSLNMSSLSTRSTRNTLKRRTVLRRDMSCALPEWCCPRCTRAKKNSNIARTTSAISKKFVTFSRPHTKSCNPIMRTLTTSSIKKMNANSPSIMIQPNHKGDTSVLTPRTKVFRTMTAPMMLSIANSRRCARARLSLTFKSSSSVNSTVRDCSLTISNVLFFGGTHLPNASDS
mmetsp:Transcript_2004/g.5966  ORF Transcript_2004/g.5966 Transcript_2004/m.5966 type:complete len:238 (+) Transcript_2004:1071-1784(+)